MDLLSEQQQQQQPPEQALQIPGPLVQRQVSDAPPLYPTLVWYAQTGGVLSQ